MSDDLVRSILKQMCTNFSHEMCKILLCDVRRIVVAFTDDKIQETGFLAIILNAA